MKYFLITGLVLLCSCVSVFNQKSAKMEVKSLTNADFLSKVIDYRANSNEWKYLGDKPCLIDFYASWCGPCKTIAPILEELAQEYEGKIHIYKVNTETEPELSAAFGIRSIPTLLFCPMNGAPHMIKGAMPKSGLIKMINEILIK